MAAPFLRHAVPVASTPLVHTHLPDAYSGGRSCVSEREVVNVGVGVGVYEIEKECWGRAMSGCLQIFCSVFECFLFISGKK